MQFGVNDSLALLVTLLTRRVGDLEKNTTVNRPMPIYMYVLAYM